MASVLLVLLTSAKTASASGIRIGTSVVTSMGMKELEMDILASIITRCLLYNEPPNLLKMRVNNLASNFTSLFFKKYNF